MDTEMTIQRTLPQLFENSVAKYSGNNLMWERKGDSYKGTTYREMHAFGNSEQFGKMDYIHLPIGMK
jgi:hypothetical protein